MPSIRTLNRRSFLFATGVALPLPWLECMAVGDSREQTPPRRFASIYFPNGVGQPKSEPLAKYRWWPAGKGQDFKFSNTLQSLEGLREHVTVVQGTEHATVRRTNGHACGDVWLTGGTITGDTYANRVSVDQVAAEQIGRHTRFDSLIMSPEGGIGIRTRTSTLSFDRNGQPIPAWYDIPKIFARMFSDGSRDSLARSRYRLRMNRSILDAVSEQSRHLQRQLGAADRQKMDQYLTSVRETEQRLGRTEAWLERPKPKVETDTSQFMETPKGSTELLRAYYDLMVLAFQTDSTRVATYQIARENGGPFDRLTQPIAGVNWHGISHKGYLEQEEHSAKWHRVDRWCADQFAYFLERLKSVREGEGTLLDHTMVLYGCSQNYAHTPKNYATVVAGGNRLGLKHGQLLHMPENTPFANVLYTLLTRLELPSCPKFFADSTGPINEMIA